MSKRGNVEENNRSKDQQNKEKLNKTTKKGNKKHKENINLNKVKT